MEFLTGVIIGIVIAGIIGRGKFLAVQNLLRDAKKDLVSRTYALTVERNLNEGLQQELHSVATKSRMTSV